MRTRDIFDHSPAILEAAHPLSNINSRLMDLEGNINEHLLCLIAFERNASEKGWRREVSAWIQNIWRLKIAREKGWTYVSAEIYFAHLWIGPFEGHEAASMEDFLTGIRQEKPNLVRNAKPMEQLIIELRDWHQKMSKIIEIHGDFRTLINIL